MADYEKNVATEHVNSASEYQASEVRGLKHSENQIVLIPQPSDSPDDPLNWSKWRKIRLLAVVCLATFAATAGVAAGSLAYVQQAPTYEKTPIELSYSVSAAIAGFGGGPLIVAPLAFIFGRSSTIFWCLLGSMCCTIWGASMTGVNDYSAFVASRVIGGVFASLPAVLGASIIMDILFLHQRGKAFLIYALTTAMGSEGATTIGGYIVSFQTWTICFWWTVPLQAIAAIVVFFVMEETSFERGTAVEVHPTQHRGYFANRIATFFPGTKTAPPVTAQKIATHAAAPFLIGVSPIGLVVGVFSLFFFGWISMLDILFAVFVQTPVELGGYGFSAVANANISYSAWLAILAAEAFGHFTNDRIPLWVCKRYRKGVWSPELRLHCLWIPLLVLPIGLGIMGAALENHYHFMVLALGNFLAVFASLLGQPIVINYLSECFTHYAVECTIIIVVYRYAWGLTIPFWVSQWEISVGVGWVFGMAALFTVALSAVNFTLVWKGGVLRAKSLVPSLITTEEGDKLVEE